MYPMTYDDSMTERQTVHQAPAVAAITGVVYLGYLLARIVIAGRGNVARLALVGTVFANRRRLPGFIPQIHGTGYDGQFFLRLALNPFYLGESYAGIHFDTPFRAQRIGYPFIVWALSGGDNRLVPLMLVVVNLIAVIAIAYLATRLAADASYPWLAGLLAAGFFGYLFSTGRDLAEPTGAAFTLIGLVLMERRHQVWAALAFAVAGLVIETELVIPIAIGLIFAWEFARLRRSNINPVTFLLPGVVALVWQVVVKTQIHHTAIKADIIGNLGIPFDALIRGLAAHAHFENHTDLIWWGQLVVFAFFVVLAGLAIRRTSAPDYLKVAYVLMVILAVSLSGELWNNSSYFRALDLLWLFSTMIWVRSRPKLPSVAWVVGVAWVVSAIPMVRGL